MDKQRKERNRIGEYWMEIAEYRAKRQKEMEILLYDLIKNWEDEVVEFKEAGNDYDKDKIGRYFPHSATKRI